MGRGDTSRITKDSCIPLVPKIPSDKSDERVKTFPLDYRHALSRAQPPVLNAVIRGRENGNIDPSFVETSELYPLSVVASQQDVVDRTFFLVAREAR